MTVTATIHTPPPDPIPDRRVVTLTMPYDVAVTLLSLTRCIGGKWDTTYRLHTRMIQAALENTNVSRGGCRFFGDIAAQPIPKE